MWLLVRELNNSTVSPPEQGVLKQERDGDNNIITSDSTLSNILLPQLNKMTSRYKVMCGCECFISTKIMHSYLLIWYNHCLKWLKYISNNAQNRRSGEISRRIFETYKNAVRSHDCHIYNTSAYMGMATMCPCTSKYHGLTHWKCLLRCCDNFPSIVLPSQE